MGYVTRYICFQSCVEGTQTWVHVDSQERIKESGQAVLYLTPDAIVDSGTGIYER